MSEVLYPFGTTVRGPDGREYSARVYGQEVAGGQWEGWVEFEPVGGGPAVRTARETTQPNREDLAYWASGLRETYFEGALERAIAPGGKRGASPERQAGGRSFADVRADAREAPDPGARAALDPFAVYAEGEGILRRQLSALSSGQLRTIARAYGLAPDPDRLELLGRTELSSLIADAVALRRR